MATDPAGSTEPNERADYGDEAAATAVTTRQEHPAVGVLRGVYQEIGKAIALVVPDRVHGVPHPIEVELHRAQAIVVEQAGKLKEAA